MTALGFKEKWIAAAVVKRWLEFDSEKLEAAPVNHATKDFLKIGFASSGAPFVNFNNDLLSLSDYYGYDHPGNRYLVLGTDGGGNPICFDTDNNDIIVLLDHEQAFELMGTMNKNISELAECLLLYRGFISKVQAENGEDAFLDGDITDEQIASLKEGLLNVNANIFTESDFWRNEVEYVRG
ncbi:SUKH-4 family immunity protein [Mucilaginibacter pedocola]|uniref:SUKH-4 immunity protein n=1 Tax=Mucilaginibacter pedocola TaxID=1792845 RepID=A0A1S9PES6_9SPHI|nr:SUKH-4 family immunity protein [Mucilaginibacter pedocola]OOQ59457.1 hypothetical protein BC343_04555 [Mucilaginibacter pedocola]